MINQTETTYPFITELLALNTSEILGVCGIIASVGVGILVWKLDSRRKDKTEEIHKRIIRNNMTELNEIVTQIILDVNELEKDEEAVSHRLNKYLIRNFSNIEFMMNNIKIHQAQCSKLNTKEEEDVDNTLKVMRWILDKYCPQDIPEERRVNRWRQYNPELKTQATRLLDAVADFSN